MEHGISISLCHHHHSSRHLLEKHVICQRIICWLASSIYLSEYVWQGEYVGFLGLFYSKLLPLWQNCQVFCGEANVLILIVIREGDGWRIFLRGKRSETMLGSMCELMWRGKTVNYYDETSESLYAPQPLIHAWRRVKVN